LKRLSIAKLRVGDEKQLYDSFFTLHEDLEAADLSKPFYSSEVVFDSTHPQWCVFHESQFENPPPTSQKKLVVCVWEVGESRVPRRLLLKVRVDLSELCFISTLALDFSECTLLFELQDGIYTTKAVRNQLEERGIIVSRDAYTDEENSKRYSCSRAAYIDIITKKRELKAKKDRIVKLTEAIQQKKSEHSHYLERLEARNELEGRLASLKSQYDLLEITYQKKKQELEAKSTVLFPMAEKLKSAQLALATSMQEMEQRRKELVAHHQQLTKTFFLIRKHQERLIRDLANVYRILPVRDANGQEARPYHSSGASSSHSSSSQVLYSINGCTLNNSHFHGQDEEKIATGLGYVCHLVQLLSKYLDIPLRYPMVPMMSRSTIQDVVVSSDRYPLYSKAQSIDQFRTAVALLNRNVEQLVLSQGLEPGPLRETLPNLKLLIDHFIQPTTQSSTSGPSHSGPPSSSSVPSQSPSLRDSAHNLTFSPSSSSLTGLENSAPPNGPSSSKSSAELAANSSQRNSVSSPSKRQSTRRDSSDSKRASSTLEDRFKTSRDTVQLPPAAIVENDEINLTSSEDSIASSSSHPDTDTAPTTS
jgi:uncharacterized DUF497 family protein